MGFFVNKEEINCDYKISGVLVQIGLNRAFYIINWVNHLMEQKTGVKTFQRRINYFANNTIRRNTIDAVSTGTLKTGLLLLLIITINFIFISSSTAAIALRGTTTTGNTTNTNLTINVPTGVVTGDVMLLNIVKYSATGSTLPTLTDWTSIASSNLSGSNQRNGAIYYRIVDGTEGASYTFAIGTSSYAAGAITAFSGVDVTGSPFDATPGTISTPGGTANSVTVTNITTNTANAAVVMFGMNSANPARNYSTWSTTSPGSLTEIYDYTGATYETVGSAWALKPTAGSTGTSSLTAAGTGSIGGILIALKPVLPPTISGFSPSNACQGTTGIVITGTNFTGATTVNFNGISAGFTVDNSTQITANVPLTATNGTISVSNAIGTATSASSFTVNPTPQGSLTANGPFCNTGAGQLTWSASSGTGPYTVIYNDGTANRTQNNVSSGTPFATFTTPVTSTKTYTLVSVTGSSGCQRTAGFTGGSTTITVSAASPAQPSTITGSTTPGQTTSQVYSVTNVPGTTYSWTFPSGWTQTAGGTSNSVTVTVGATSGNITVTPSNACGTGTVRNLAIAVATCIVAQPVDRRICPNSNTTFSITTSGTCRWQVLNTDNTNGVVPAWTNLNNGGIYSGTGTATLTLTNVTADYNNFQYRCVVTGSCTATSNAAVLNIGVTAKYTLTANPGIIDIGGTSILSLSGSQTGVSYQLRTGTTNIGAAVAGTGNAISFASVNPITSTNYNVLATSACSSIEQYSTRAVIVREQGLIIEITPCQGQPGSNFFTNSEFGTTTTNVYTTTTLQNAFPGVAFGAPLGGTYTPYTYGVDGGNEVNDNYYVIANSTEGMYRPPRQTAEAWMLVKDRYNPGTGHIYIVNADLTPGAFYNETISNLCDSTKYEFSADIINIINPEHVPNGRQTLSYYPNDNQGRPYTILPNIDFLINGKVAFNTGNLMNDGQWKTFGFTFRSGGLSSIILTIRNNSVGGIGNDLALDNIVMRACGPVIQLNITTVPAIVCPGTPVTMTGNILTSDFHSPVYQWQKSTDGGNSWINLSGFTVGATSTSYQENNPVYGHQYRFITGETTQSLSNSNCYVASNVITIETTADILTTTPATRCGTGTATLSATANSGATIKWYSDAGGTVQVGTGASYTTPSLSATTSYYVNASKDGCTSPLKTVVATVYPSAVSPAVTIAVSPGTNICSGNTVTFTATPTNGGTAPLYQWKKNGVNIPGATNSTYTTNTIANNNAITCLMTENPNNACITGDPGTATSNQITMTVGAMAASVSIAASPGTTVCSGSPVTFTATPTNGGSVPTYQWKLNGSNISGATNSTYTTSALANGSQITCVMTSSFVCATNSPATSGATSMTVNPTTVISSQSTTTQTKCIGGTFTPITVTASGSGLTYQWYSNTTASTTGGTSKGTANGAQTNSYTPQTTAAGTLYYYCIITGTCGTATSAVSGAFIVNPASVGGTANASSSTLCSGNSTIITLSSNTGTIQWQQSDNGSTGWINVIGGSGATSASYTTANLTATLYYRAVVTSGVCASANSSITSVTVNPITAISAQSTGTQTQCINGTFNPITVTATGVGLSYQWFSNTTTATTGGTSLGATSGGQTNSYTPQSTSAGTRYYYCVVTGTCGTATTAASGAFIVNPATAISAQSTATQTQCTGGTFTPISVTAVGTGLTYQWYSNTTASTSGGTSLGAANGAQTNTYTPQTGVAGSLYYYCIVSGTCGNATSAISGEFIVTAYVNASISIVADPSTVYCAGNNITFNSTPANGGGSPTYQWYKNSSPISGATSASYTSVALNNADAFYCIMTSSLACVNNSPATSNSIAVEENTTPTITCPSNISVDFTDADFAGYWQYRKPVTITNAGGALSAYQVRIDVAMIAGKMNADFSDIRFRDSDESTELAHWLEQNDGSNAIFWVNVPTIPASSNKTIYIYYGNTGVVTTSNANATFIYYNDMSSISGWSDLSSGSVAINSSEFGYDVLLKQSNDDPSGGQISIGTTLSDFKLISREYRGTNGPGGIGNSGGNNRYGMEDGSGNGYTLNRVAQTTGNSTMGYERRTAGTASNGSTISISQPENNWYITELTRNGTSIQASLFSDAHTGGSTSSGTDGTHTSFSYISIRGGHYYYIDWMAVANSAATEPTTVFGSEETLGTSNCAKAVIVPAPIVTDNSGSYTLVNDFNATSDASDTYPVGTTLVEYTVTDNCGLTNTCTFSVTVNDLVDPILSCPADVITTYSNNPLTIDQPAFNDNCPGASITNDKTGTSNASGNYPLGSTTVIWTLTDASGNTANCSMNVNVFPDNPVAINTPQTIVCENEVVTYSATETYDTYTWTVSGGTPTNSTSSSVDVTWGTGNIGTVTLEGFIGGISAGTATETIYISHLSPYTFAPNASTTPVDTLICADDFAPLRVSFTDKSLLFTPATIDGTNDYISIPNSNYINSGVQYYRTVAVWFKALDVTSRQVIYDEGGATNGFAIYIDAGSIYVHAWEGGSGGTWGAPSSAISIGVWYHVAFVFDKDATDGFHWKGYLNGSSIGQFNVGTAGDDGLASHTGDVSIGESGDIRFHDNSTANGNYYHGYLDEFKLWNKALTSAQINTEMYHWKKSPISESNFDVYINFNNSVADISTSTGSEDGTFSGSPSYSTDAPLLPDISWSPGAASTYTNNVNPTTTTTYTFTLTEKMNGSCSQNDNITVNVEDCGIDLSGLVFNDEDAMLINNKVDGTALSSVEGNQLYAVLINHTTDQVIQTVAVVTGTYLFTTVTIGLDLELLITTTNYSIGTTAPTTSIPAPWEFTGEKQNDAGNTLTGNDGTVDGRYSLGVTSTNQKYINFGIRKPFTVTVSPNGTSDCPDLNNGTNPAFNPDNASYNHGATRLTFTITPTGTAPSDWSFDFSISGTITVPSGASNITQLNLTGDTLPAPSTPGTTSGTVSAGANSYVDLIFDIENTPGSSQIINITISNPTNNNTNNVGSGAGATFTIDAMPSVGSFN